MYSNFFGVLLAALSTMIIGSLWYSPLLFGNLWMKLSGITVKDIEKGKGENSMAKLYFVQFIASLLMAYVLNFTLRVFLGFGPGNMVSEELNVLHAIIFAIFLWLGFIAPVGIGMVIWENKPLKLYFLQMGHYLFALIVMIVILFFVR